MTSIHADISRFFVRAKKKFGQNFLTDKKVLSAIAAFYPIAHENIVEVGPGFGALTTFLAEKNPVQLHLVELDTEMLSILAERSRAGEFSVAPILHHADVLKWKFPDSKASYRVFGNIPYYITSPILRHFLYAEHAPLSCVFLMQREVAEKILLTDGKHSVLSLLVAWRARTISRVVNVAAHAFVPAPKVDSCAIGIELAPPPPKSETEKFLQLIHAGFSEKRKQLAGNFARSLGGTRSEWEKHLISLGLRSDVRAEDVSLDHWKQLVHLTLS